ncbi:MAG: tRNA (adenosine(37)-N6)-dimethylallyltransferase MiaA [Thermodesulfobacteriales bacterium]|nr:MAG: tRNA (adenosine(37)-N6)-dimethylallyltransferase MiaA [Thermodesulfobacteriales bacterium]
MEHKKPKLIVVLGPTAVGKSAVGIDIAKRLRGEIINADSLQVYKHLNIGTAKPSSKELHEVSHHLINIVDPDEDFNAGMFRSRAASTIKDLHEANKNIILVGGTYLYVKVLLSGLIEGLPANMEIRENIKKLRAIFGLPYVYDRLLLLDPEAAARIHPNDYVRAERALEVNYLTGQKMSELQAVHSFQDQDYEYFKIGISLDREILKERIDKRVDIMIKEGLVEEVRKLREMGYHNNLKPMQSIGYKEINQFLDGEIDIDEAVELIKRDTKRFAKRQMTWLKKDNEINWFEKDKDFDQILDKAREFFES